MLEEHCLCAAQMYGLQQLLQKCIDFVRCKSFTELQKDPYFKRLEPGNLIRILELRVLDLESTIEQVRDLFRCGAVAKCEVTLVVIAGFDFISDCLPLLL